VFGYSFNILPTHIVGQLLSLILNMIRSSLKVLPGIVCLLFCFTAKAIPVIRLQAGMVIRESVTISRENYTLDAET